MTALLLTALAAATFGATALVIDRAVCWLLRPRSEHWVDGGLEVVLDAAERKETTMPRPAKQADEYDVVTGWRRVLVWRPGEVARIKRRIRRRERHVGKHHLRTAPEDQ